MAENIRGKKWFLTASLGVLCCVLLAVGVIALRGKSIFAAAHGDNGAAAESARGDRDRPSVQTVHPKKQPSLVVSVKELARAEAFYQADLRARTAGQVRTIYKDIHNTVAKGEVLIRLDAPELDADVARKAAEVEQKLKEVLLAERKAEIAKAAEEVAQETIDLKKAAVTEAEATRDLRKFRLERFQLLAKTEDVSDAVVEEVKRDHRIALADCARTEADVRKATAEWRQMQATSAAALADIQQKKVAVEVARRERDYAQTLADLTKITAPFDGVILKRNVDPGSFVQNSTTTYTEPLIIVARTDIMTVSMKVPDNYAALVSVNTEAVLQIDDLPNVLLHGKVTRYSPSIDLKDRTMLVEVDLFNGTEAEYQRFVAESVAAILAPLGSPGPGQALCAEAAGRQAVSRHRKGIDDPLPLMPRVSGRAQAGQPRRLLPGMSGQMTLLLRQLRDAYVLPESAVFSRGGERYIALVIGGKVHLAPVKVQVDDGNWVKVEIISQRDGEVVEDYSDLTGAEEIVASGQGELEEGQAVNASPEP
jgi:multidrug efflux pump subunit AcrA (membrane-fusion protein)